MLLVLGSPSGATSTLFYWASHTYAHYPIAEKIFLAELLRLEKMCISVYSVFVGYAYLKSEQFGCQNSHSLCYSTYLIPLSYSQEDADAFPYGEIFAVRKICIKFSEKTSGAEYSVNKHN